MAETIGGVDTAELTENEIAQIDAINTTSSYCRTLFFSYLALGATLFILVSGTNHEDLLRETPVKMPLFDIGVPLLTFYVVAPLLFVLFHFNLLNKLSQLRMQILHFINRGHDYKEKVTPPLLAVVVTKVLSQLGRRISDFVVRPSVEHGKTNDSLVEFWLHWHAAQCDKEKTQQNAQQRRDEAKKRANAARPYLFPLDYGLLLGKFETDTKERWVLMLIVGVTIFVMPVLLLLYTQFQFLPYHHSWITNAHLALVVIDLGALAFFHYVVANDFRADISKTLASAICLLVIVFSTALTPPHSWADRCFVPKVWEWAENRFDVHRNLQLSDRTFWAADPPPEIVAAYITKYGADGPKVKEARLRYGRAMDLSGRDLSYANLAFATLTEARFEDANLYGADLNYAELQGAIFWDSDLRHVGLAGAQLQDADFGVEPLQDHAGPISQLLWDAATGVQLQGADLSYAEIQRANLSRAQLEGANLFNARLQGASLFGAHLYGANLSGAQLQGADLSFAQLQGADFGMEESAPDHATRLLLGRTYAANLQGTNLLLAQLQGADLSYAQLQGANLRNAELQGADLSGAQLQGASLEGVQFQSAVFRDANLNLAKFADAKATTPAEEDRESFWAMQSNLAKRLPHGYNRHNMLKRVERAVQAPLVPDFGPSATLNERLAGSLRGNTAVFRNWPSDINKSEFEAGLAAYLADLACANADVANGIARVRAVRRFGIPDPHGLVIARVFLARECEGGTMLADALSDIAISRLTEVIARAERRGGEEDDG